jgi:hypothetical protein
VFLRALIAVLLIVRLAGMISIERALWRGEAGVAWHPDLTQLGRFAADRAGEAIFIAADWGVATQIYCFSNGRPGFVEEPIWSYAGPTQLLRLQQQSGTDTLYAVALKPPSSVKPATTERIFRDLASSPYWREAPVDAEASSFSAVTVRKFVSAAPPAGLLRPGNGTSGRTQRCPADLVTRSPEGVAPRSQG